MKRMFSYLLLLILMASTNEWAGTQELTLIVEKASGEVGSDSSIVTISLENTIPIRGSQFTLIDLPNDLELRSLLKTTRTLNMFTSGNDLENGSAKVLQFSLSGETIPPGFGPIMELVFSVSEDAQIGRHSLNLSEVVIADSANNAAPVTIMNGFFDVLEPSAVKSNDRTPEYYEVLNSYPNPFAPSITIGYHLLQPGPVKINIYNSLGQLVTKLTDTWSTVGYHQIVWDGMDNAGNHVSPGTYLCVCQTPERVISKRITYIR